MLPFKKILCPTDFSEPSFRAMEEAKELASHFSAEMLIVHVIPILPVIAASEASATSQQELEVDSAKALRDVLEQRIPKELNARPVMLKGDAASQIVQTAEEEKTDLIVIATHGRTGWRHLIFGSVAEKVVRLSPCPVLTISEPQKEQ